MMKKIIKNTAVWLMVAVLCFSSGSPVCAEASSMPDITAKYCEAFDITAGQKLFGKSENEKMYPASITKVMFAEVLLDWLNENGRKETSAAGTVTSQDNENAAAAGLYRSGLKANEKVTWSDLLHSILLMSGAEACYAAARLSFGSEKKAAAKMNEKASALGLKKSHFENITGAHSYSHYTTCSDYVKVMQNAWGYDAMQKIFSSPAYTTSDGKHTFRSPTARAAADGGSELIGGKTGTTNMAQHTFAGFAKISEHIIVIIVGLCPLSVSFSNIKDAGAVAKYIRENFELKKIPEKVSAGNSVYAAQSRGQVLMRKGASNVSVKAGKIVMESEGQEAIIPAEKLNEKKKESEVLKNPKTKKIKNKTLPGFASGIFSFIIRKLKKIIKISRHLPVFRSLI